MFGPRHARLLIGAVFPAVLATWLLFSSVELLGTFFNETDEIGIGEYSLADALSYTLLTLPHTLYGMLPYGVIVGLLIGLGQLAGRSELIALQAAGASRGRIGSIVVLAVIVLAALVMYGAETVGSQAYRMANALVAQAKQQQGLSIGTSSGLWMKDGLDIINAATVVTSESSDSNKPDLWKVRIYRFSGASKLTSVISAADAKPTDEGWLLRDVSIQQVEGAIAVTTQPTLAWRSSLRADLIAARSLRPRQQSLAELTRSIGYARNNALDDQTLVSAWWYRFTFPLKVLSLALLALPFAFGNLRSGGFAKRVFMGMLLGIAFYFLQRTVANLFETLHWNLAVAHLLPPALLALTGMWLLKRGAAR